MSKAESADNKVSTLESYFENKNVFVTGGTGFLGAVLIEALLSSTPHIGNIYILIRGKKGLDSGDRIKRLLSKPIFEKHSEKMLQKIIPVNGDLTEPNFGFDDQLYENLLQNVNIIYHSAATIRFLSYLGTAININMIGTMRTIEFAKNLKNYSSYIYVSTSFCNTNFTDVKILEETVYQPKYDPYKMMEMAKNNYTFPREGDELKDFLKGHPNTYTFTKQLAENLILKEMEGYATGIVRPSIVYGTYMNPVKGWMGSANNGHLGFLVGFYKGVFRTMNNEPSAILDMIPVDYVVNSTLVLSWYVATRNVLKTEVMHCTSGEVNPITFQDQCDILNDAVKKHPSNLMIWKPYVKIRTSWRYTAFVALFHYIPAMIIYIPEKLLPIKKPSHSVLSYIKIFDNGTKAFDYFVKRNFRYSLTNSFKILSHLTPEDRERYNYDCSLCDWTSFLENCLLGLRRYIFKESTETTIYHRIMWNIFEVLNYLGLLFLFCAIYYLSSFVLETGIALGFSIIIFLFLLWL